MSNNLNNNNNAQDQNLNNSSSNASNNNHNQNKTGLPQNTNSSISAQNTPMHSRNQNASQGNSSENKLNLRLKDPSNGSRSSIAHNANRFAPALNVLGDVSFRNGRHFWRCRVSSYGWAIGIAFTNIKVVEVCN